MIKINKGELAITGKKSDVLADFILIAHSLLDAKAFSVKELQYAVEVAAKNEDELDEDLEQDWEDADD